VVARGQPSSLLASATKLKLLLHWSSKNVRRSALWGEEFIRTHRRKRCSAALSFIYGRACLADHNTPIWGLGNTLIRVGSVFIVESTLRDGVGVASIVFKIHSFKQNTPVPTSNTADCGGLCPKLVSIAQSKAKAGLYFSAMCDLLAIHYNVALRTCPLHGKCRRYDSVKKSQ